MNGILLMYGILGSNLGLAIIAVTFLMRVALFPFMKSQLDSTMKLRKIQPQLEKIREKYSRNPQKMQEEQLKLYKKVGYNPLGCLMSVVLPYPLLVAIYQAIQAFSGDKVTGIYPFVMDFLGINGDLKINTHFLLWDLSKSYLPLAKEAGGHFEDYLGWGVLAYLVLALLTGVSQYFSVKINSKLSGADKARKEADEKKKKNKKKKKDDTPDMSSMMGDMGKSMAFTFPLMTTFIALSAPAAVAIYWIVQSWVMVGIQTLYFSIKNKKASK